MRTVECAGKAQRCTSTLGDYAIREYGCSPTLHTPALAQTTGG